MKIALGTDHRGAEAGRALDGYLADKGHAVLGFGDNSGEPCDYPDIAYLVAQAVAAGEAERGILVCGTGVGMSIAANKVCGIRAALAYDEIAADFSRRHNDANVLCLAGESLSREQIFKIVDVWLDGRFDGGRHERRVRKIAAIERGEDPVETVSDAATT
ncbi:MAG: ribose 5-phosphate isomerase B [Planctomycetota bacterium]|jgi:ribose 5-phosphate isomerase B